MKKLNILALLSALLLLIPAFVSCDKDDNGDKDEPAEIDHVIGTYTGTMVASVSAMGHVYDDIPMEGTYEIKISSQDNASGRVVVELPECSYTPPMGSNLETIAALTVDNVEVEENGNGLYSLDKDEFTVAVDGVQYTLNIEDYDSDDKSGTLIAGRDIKLVYTITPGKMPGFIKFTFTGTLK
ncbi:MAG: calycin-like domain-containing protein [Muribaculaceae bacterium]|nr:calycin-like domain-containing protein [Muribaculaceae bacterium]